MDRREGRDRAKGEAHRKRLRNHPRQPESPEATSNGDAWFDAWEKSRIARGLASTADNRRHYLGFIRPAVDGKHVRDWSTDDVRAIVALLDEKICEGDISPKYASNVWGTATKMCTDAVKSKLAELRVRADNPSKDVASPESGEQRAKQFLFPSEFLSLLECEEIPLRWRRAIAVAVYLYPRAGEQRALRWADVDLDHGLVHIHQAFERRSRTLGSTKSGRSRRFVIEPVLLPLLRTMHQEAGGEGDVAPIPNRMASRLREWLKKAKITREELLDEKSTTTRSLSWHDLRATGLTWAAVRGDDPLKIMSRAGHSDFQTTQIYIRIAEALREGFGDVIPAIPLSLLQPESSGESSEEPPSTPKLLNLLKNPGAGHGIRTRDIKHGKLALYQLS
jgi:integrase